MANKNGLRSQGLDKTSPALNYSPLLENEFRKNYKRSVGISWRMDETYIKIKGVWH